MQCPECKSKKIQKNGKKRGKQNHLCVQCPKGYRFAYGRQFITEHNQHRGYSDEFKRECLKLYVNGLGFRAIERVKGVHNTTVMSWVQEVGELLPDAYTPETIPQVGELDELETFVSQKKTKFGFGQQ
jgi:transposase-like protein